LPRCICSRRLGPGKGNSMDVVAMAPIAEGAEIKTRYMTPQWGTVRRQQLTQNYWHFVCRCDRCLDPTEFGSMLNAVVCQRCLPHEKSNGQVGFMLPVRSTDLASPWKCSACDEDTAASEVMATLLRFEVAVEKVSDCVELRSLICSDETSRTLHPNHFLLIGAKEKMIMGLKLELRRMRNGGREKEKARSEARVCLEEQVAVFKEVHSVMVMVDLAPELWDEALRKLESDLGNLISDEEQSS